MKWGMFIFKAKTWLFEVIKRLTLSTEDMPNILQSPKHFSTENKNSIRKLEAVRRFLFFWQTIFNMLHALSIGELFDGVEIIMVMGKQIFRNSAKFNYYFKPNCARTSN